MALIPSSKPGLVRFSLYPFYTVEYTRSIKKWKIFRIDRKPHASEINSVEVATFNYKNSAHVCCKALNHERHLL